MRRRALELLVSNHPGVMVHVAGLFARRAFNLDGILCGPVGDGRTSRMLLLVADEARLEQLVRQLRKLHDVTSVTERPTVDDAWFRVPSADGPADSPPTGVTPRVF
jgi:acetolactate synthase-1/3 small subunit